MPIIKSAKKKMRQDKKRRKTNLRYDLMITKAIKEVKKARDKAKITKLVAQAYAAIDKCAKKKLIHKNKAAHLKSMISKYARSKR